MREARDGAGNFRLLRGGSWNNNPRNCRSAIRNRNQSANRNNNIGFRVACVAASAPLVRVGRWEFTEGTRGVQPGSSDGGDFIQKSN